MKSASEWLVKSLENESFRKAYYEEKQARNRRLHQKPDHEEGHDGLVDAQATATRHEGHATRLLRELRAKLPAAPRFTGPDPIEVAIEFATTRREIRRQIMAAKRRLRQIGVK